MPSSKRTFAIDYHVHIDERVDFKEIPQMMRTRKLDGAGILTHNNFSFAKEITDKFNKIDSEKVYFAGVEIDTADGHLIAYGIDQEIPENKSSEETIELISKLGGISIIPHPFMSHNSIGWKSYILEADGMEFYNGFAKIFLNFPNIMAKVSFKHNSFSALGGSDSHFHKAIGTCYTDIEIDGELTEAKILDAVRYGNTIPRIKPIDIYDIYNFIRIVFTPKDGRKAVKIFD